MNRGRRSNKFCGGADSRLYMDLKDIVRENALHFLPAKSLLKARSVCRDWKLQISTPFFEHKQSISFSSIGGMFVQLPGEPSMFVPFHPSSCGVPDPSLGFLPGAVDIISSSNGLLLCRACSGDRGYYVCNPLTQKFKKISNPTANHGTDPAIVLVFEPSLLNFEAEYKIVCAIQSADFDDATEFDIYSSRDGSWKTSAEICFASGSHKLKHGIYANGVIYFFTAVKHGSPLSYDVAKDKSQLLKNYYGYSGTMGVVKGNLCSAYFNGNTVVLTQFVNYHSKPMQINSGFNRMGNYQHVITLDREVLGSDVVTPTVLFAGGDVLIIQAGSRLISYDLDTKLTVELSNLPGGVVTRLVPYVNSLVSI